MSKEIVKSELHRIVFDTFSARILFQGGFRIKIELTNSSDGSEVSHVSDLNYEETREREGDIYSAEGEGAVNSKYHSSSHFELLYNEEG